MDAWTQHEAEYRRAQARRTRVRHFVMDLMLALLFVAEVIAFLFIVFVVICFVAYAL